MKNTFRYIDDILHVSSQPNEFEKITKEMYHNSLTLEQTNSSEYTTTFLDLDLKSHQSNITIQLYNKTDDYNFTIIRYPHYHSTVPLRIGLNTLHGEMIRNYRNCTEYCDFITRMATLINTYKKNQYPLEIIATRLLRTIGMNPSIPLKYKVNNSSLYVKILSLIHA